MKKGILSILVIGFALMAVPQSASANTDTEALHDRLRALKQELEVLHLRLLEERDIPRLEKAVPREAEIGEPVIIRGEGFTASVDVLFDTNVALRNVEPVNENLIAFKVPKKFMAQMQCSLAGKNSICASVPFTSMLDFETYDVRVRAQNGLSNAVSLKIVDEE